LVLASHPHHLCKPEELSQLWSSNHLASDFPGTIAEQVASEEGERPRNPALPVSL